jgi:hypothetical protein
MFGVVADVVKAGAKRLQRAKDTGYTTDLYHGTHSDFDAVDPDKVDLGIHLGSEQQANNRIKALSKERSGYPVENDAFFERNNIPLHAKGANIIPIKARLGKSLEMEDVGDFSSSIQVIEGLLENKAFSSQADQNLLKQMMQDARQSLSEYGDFNAFYKSPENRELLDEINRGIRYKGYDSVKYLNEVENNYGKTAGLNKAGMEQREKLKNAVKEIDAKIRDRMPKLPKQGDPNEMELRQKYVDARPEQFTSVEETQKRNNLKAELMDLNDNPKYQEDPNSYIALKPSDVRSRFAQFKDPSSDNILAGSAATAVGASSLIGSQDADASPVKAVVNKIKGYHGSPHDFDKFSTDNIGTGEGAQAYGRGLYFAERKGTAESYRDSLTARDAEYEDWIGRQYKNAENQGDYGRMEMYERAMMHDLPKDFRETAADLDYDEDYRDLANQVADEIESFTKVDGTKPNFGKMYEVDIDASDTTLLDYDVKLKDQPTEVQEKIFKAFNDDLKSTVTKDDEKLVGELFENDELDELLQGMPSIKEQLLDSNGAQIMGRIKANDPVVQSKVLESAGIKGIKYADAQTRFSPKGKTHNYVIFDDKLIEISRKYGIPPAMATAVLAGTLTPEQAQAQTESTARQNMTRRERRANPPSEVLRNYEQGKILPTLQNMGVGLVEGAADTLDILDPVNLGLNILNPANESAMRFLTPKYTPNKEAVAPLTDMRFYDQADPDSEKARKNARMAGALFSPI